MADAEKKSEDEQLNGELPESDAEMETSKKPGALATIPKEELDRIKQEAAEYKDKYLRLLAEADNLRKRMLKEKQELIQYAVQNVIIDFLNPIDHLENALQFAKNMSDEVKHWAIGFEMILNQFKEVLANNGVAPFQSVGMKFDPNCHEAVETEETTSVAEGTVVAESLRGYKMGGKTIRPARVKVAKAPPKQKPQEEQKKT